MAERRKATRHSISYYLRIINVGSNQMLGHLTDLSLTGLRLDCQKIIMANKPFRLRINTTPDISTKDYFEFDACSKWCKVDQIQPGLYNVGFEITGIDPNDREIIIQIIEKYSALEKSFYFKEAGE
jgi:hypothetical protein